MRLHAGYWYQKFRYRSCSTLKDALVHSTWETIQFLIHCARVSCPTNREEKSFEERGSYKEKKIAISGFIDYKTAYSFFLEPGVYRTNKQERCDDILLSVLFCPSPWYLHFLLYGLADAPSAFHWAFFSKFMFVRDSCLFIPYNVIRSSVITLKDHGVESWINKL